MTFPTCPNNEFANPELRVGLTRWRLRREAFVVMLVCADNEVRSLFVEIIPERLHPGRIAVFCPRSKERVVPDRKSAGRRVGREI